MGGIAKIQAHREEIKERSKAASTMLWLRDGEEARGTILASGEADDPRFDDFFVHSVQYVRDDGVKGWKDTFCLGTIEQPCPLCEAGQRPQHRFGFWMYVDHILHPEKKNDSWVDVAPTAPGGAKKFREDVKDFRIFSRGFGKGEYLWNMVVDMFTEQGGLNKNVVRIKRVGGGKTDTSYQIQPTGNKADVPTEKRDEAKALPGIRDFFASRGKQQEGEDAPPFDTTTGSPSPSDDSLDF